MDATNGFGNESAREQLLPQLLAKELNGAIGMIKTEGNYASTRSPQKCPDVSGFPFMEPISLFLYSRGSPLELFPLYTGVFMPPASW
jgi:hypothetical protein